MDSRQASKLIARWRGGLKGLLAFIKDADLQVLEGGRWVKFELWPWQLEALEQLFAVKPFPRAVVFILPRRSGKTVLAAILTLWAAYTRPNATIGAGANSEAQAGLVPFRMLRNLLLRSELLLELAGGAGNVREERIVLPSFGSVILPLPNSPASVYGIGFGPVAWVSELGEGGPDLYNTMASGILDREDAFIIVDSTPSGPEHLLSTLYKSAGNLGGPDPTTFVYYRSWRPGEPMLNPHLRPADLEARRMQMLPAQFARLHCAEWVAGGSLLFAPEDIAKSRVDRALGIGELRERYEHVETALGCDLALEGSAHGDRSYMVLVAQGLNPLEEVGPEPLWPGQQRQVERVEREDFHVLRVTETPSFTAQREEYEACWRLLGEAPGVTLVEQYQGGALKEYIGTRRRGVTIVHSSRPAQAAMFTEFHKRLSQGQMRIPRGEGFDELVRQMGIFEVDASGVTPVFGARGKGRGTNRDDAVDATALALSGLRSWTGQWGCMV